MRRSSTSSFFDAIEGGFGRANLRAAFALFDDDPAKVNTILGELDQINVADAAPIDLTNLTNSVGWRRLWMEVAWPRQPRS